jgi:hypothetical protein
MKPIALLSHVTQDVRVVVLSLFAAALSACGGDDSNLEPVAVIHQAASATSSGASQPSSAPITVAWSTPTPPARVFDYASAATPSATTHGHRVSFSTTTGHSNFNTATPLPRTSLSTQGAMLSGATM